jgi:quercetin dioxygenase-like cupin family protein
LTIKGDTMNEETGAAGTANFVSGPGAGRAEQILGVSQIYKAESHQTSGRLACVEITVPPGQGIPPHRHTQEDESFYVLRGRIVIEGDDCGSKPLELEKGSFFHGPRGRVHGFRNAGLETATLLVFISPGTGIEAMFARLADLTRAQGAGIDPAQVVGVCGNYGISFVPPG